MTSDIRARLERPHLSQRKRAAGFSRWDALALTAGVALLLAGGVAVGAANRGRADRAACVNNLRQIGKAMQLWANDHQDRMPQEVPVADGGTMLHPLAVNPWVHFSWISNELLHAQTLFCPAEQGRPARDFSTDPARGYANPSFQNTATSYFLSHAQSGFAGWDILAGDRSLRSEGTTSCARFRTASLLDPTTHRQQWNTNLHVNAGNLLFFDGRVVETSNATLPAQFAAFGFEDNSQFHFISPR